MICYVCQKELSKENETEEHIILNALGGKLKSKKLICISCNSKFGSGIDNKLSSQLQSIATLINVKRDRGKPQNVKAKHGSKEILIEPGGKMKLSRAYHKIDGNVYHIEAPSIGEARKVLLGLKRKHPQLDIDKALENVEPIKDKNVNAKIELNFGGYEISRAFCKMAVNFFIFHGGNPKDIQHLLPFIEGKVKEADVHYFYPRSEVITKGKEEILHSIILKGDKLRKQLYVYIELFNEFKMIVFLSRDYQGEDLYESYHYNLVTNEILEYETDFMITAKEFKKSISKEIDEAKFLERLNYLFQQIRDVNVNRKIHEITTSSMEELIQKFPQEENPEFTEEMINIFTKTVIGKYLSVFQK
ncbi:HNH endonuclease [Bacillus mojavensis]|uniref:HNH endonuclease n=1 Tax=Bacillus mojavensis TaxID=72360 RepID=A0ABX6LVC8_BACMO|nr:HNH endonuclease [Bacillus mojavensis]QJC95408.1 HNH endonuclease [Bacillus mojavensis]